MGYITTGPFVTGGAPGVDSGFLNNVETFLTSINSAATDSHITADGTGLMALLGLKANPTAVTVTGSSGTASLYQFLRGTVKAFIVAYTNYANSATQNLVLPTAHTAASWFWTGETQGGTVTFLSSGTGVVCSTQNTIASTGGTQNAVTNLPSWTQGHTRVGFDTVQLHFNGGVNANGLMFCIGS